MSDDGDAVGYGFEHHDLQPVPLLRRPDDTDQQTTSRPNELPAEPEGSRVKGQKAPHFCRTPGLRIPRHRATTAHPRRALPAHSSRELSARGIWMGIDHEAGRSSFHYDPFELYRQGVIRP